MTQAEGNKVSERLSTKNNNQPLMGVEQRCMMMEQAAEDKRGWRAMECGGGGVGDGGDDKGADSGGSNGSAGGGKHALMIADCCYFL
jgi:hypothetical protein